MAKSRSIPRLATTILIGLALAGLMVPGAALAQGSEPTAAQNDDNVQRVGDEVSAGATSVGPPPAGLQGVVVRGLPFTGLDVVALAAIALALTTMGFALRWLTFVSPDDQP